MTGPKNQYAIKGDNIMAALKDEDIVEYGLAEYQDITRLRRRYWISAKMPGFRRCFSWPRLRHWVDARYLPLAFALISHGHFGHSMQRRGLMRRCLKLWRVTRTQWHHRQSTSGITGRLCAATIILWGIICGSGLGIFSVPCVGIISTHTPVSGMHC